MVSGTAYHCLPLQTARLWPGSEQVGWLVDEGLVALVFAASSSEVGPSAYRDYFDEALPSVASLGSLARAGSTASGPAVGAMGVAMGCSDSELTCAGGTWG